jgi:pimeloyl-ACP methyl ester carboxylesterase
VNRFRNAQPLTIFLFLVLMGSGSSEETEKGPESVRFTSDDGLPVTADLYLAETDAAPLILLFHRAGWSRGEYTEIAPKLVELGFDCLAVDQRSGGEINGVQNETHREARDRGIQTSYVDALPDLEAALSYATDSLDADRVVLWGSSYSASLVLVLAGICPEEVAGIVAFSPGEYLTVDGRSIESHARSVRCPIFVASAPGERSKWAPIFDAVPSEEKISFVPDSGGAHGSEALWEGPEGHEEYWEAVREFLGRFLP